jgi:hypothetical protein
MEITKVCRRCEQSLSLDCFYNSPRNRYGKKTICKQCSHKENREYLKNTPGKMLQYARKWKKENRDQYNGIQRAWRSENQLKVKRSNLRVYGLSLEDFDRMVSEQEGKCAICKKIPKKILCVDHCHDSGIVRSLLCNQCNAALGFLHEDPTIIESLLSYVKRHKEGKYEFFV